MKVCYKTSQCVFTSSSYLLKASGGRNCRIEKDEECPNTEEEFLFKECYSDVAGSSIPSIDFGEPLKVYHETTSEEDENTNYEGINYKEKYEKLKEKIELFYKEIDSNLGLTRGDPFVKKDICNRLFEISISQDPITHPIKKENNNSIYKILSYDREGHRLKTNCPFGKACKIGSNICMKCINHMNKDGKNKKVWCYGNEEK